MVAAICFSFLELLPFRAHFDVGRALTLPLLTKTASRSYSSHSSFVKKVDSLVELSFRLAQRRAEE